MAWHAIKGNFSIFLDIRLYISVHDFNSRNESINE